MFVEIGYLPGYSPGGHRHSSKKRRCKYDRGTKKKRKWRAALRKFKRRKKRQRKRARSSSSSKTSKSTVTSADKAKKEKRKMRKKRKKLRKKKLKMRKHRLKRHLLASKTRKMDIKMEVKKKIKEKKLTKEWIKNRLKVLKKKRVRIIFEFKRYHAFNCAPKRKAIRHLKKACKKARHRKKKYRRYRRKLKRLAKKRGIKQWRIPKKDPEKPSTTPVWTQIPHVKKTEPAPKKRVEYENIFDMMPTINALEMKNEDKHIKAGAKVSFGSYCILVRGDILGNYGKMDAKIAYINPCQIVKCDLRWQVQLCHDKTGSKEAKILAQLSMIGSQNSLRVLAYGAYMNLQYVLTPQAITTLEELLEKYPTMETSVCVHIIQQTFYCVSDLHKIGYSHLQIRPSSFSILKKSQQTFVLNQFQFSETREDLREKSLMSGQEVRRYNRSFDGKIRYPKNHIHPYSSRRQHFRLVKGTADDYESWFYVCARVLNGKPLEWEKETEHHEMAMTKYNFIKNYQHSDPFINMKMRTLLKYCLSANDQNTRKVAYFIERIIQDWKDRNPLKTLLPWQNKKDEENKKNDEDEWMSKNKWMKPLSERICKY